MGEENPQEMVNMDLLMGQLEGKLHPSRLVQDLLGPNTPFTKSLLTNTRDKVGKLSKQEYFFAQ